MTPWWIRFSRHTQNANSKRYGQRIITYAMTGGGLYWTGYALWDLYGLVTGRTASLEEQNRKLNLQLRIYEEQQRAAVEKALEDEKLIALIPISEEDRKYFKKIRGHSSWDDSEIQRAIFACYKTSLDIDAIDSITRNKQFYGIPKHEE